ncbi:MAG: DUF29 domain-containing protein [Nodosilinea sp.]
MLSPRFQNAVSNLYDQDFHLWLQQTVQALKNRDLDHLDWENLIEEIDSMARSEKKELKSRLIVIIEHLLKLMFWDSEKAQNARGWRSTLIEQRSQLELVLDDSPSLKPWLDEVFLDCYGKARLQTLRKYELPQICFPEMAPFSLADALNPDFLPD